MKVEDVDRIEDLLNEIEDDKRQLQDQIDSLDDKVSEIQSLFDREVRDFDHMTRKASSVVENLRKDLQGFRFTRRLGRELRNLKQRLIRDEERGRNRRRNERSSEQALKDLRRYLNKGRGE